MIVAVFVAACGNDKPVTGEAPLAPGPATVSTGDSAGVAAEGPTSAATRAEIEPTRDGRGESVAVAIADCTGRRYPIGPRSLTGFGLGEPRGRGVGIHARCDAGACSITVTYGAASIEVATLSGGDRIEDESVSRGDLDRDGIADLAVGVRIEQDYGPDDSQMVIEHRELVVVRLDPLAVIWQVEAESVPPEAAGWHCTSEVTVSDADCDGVRERIDQRRRCALLLCDSSLAGDQYAADCARSPTHEDLAYRRDASGRFVSTR